MGAFYVNVGVFMLMGAFINFWGRFYSDVGVINFCGILCFNVGIHI
jgi:hypothetical protein